MESLPPRLFSILTLVLLAITAGCGLTIRFGGEEFKNAVTGHMVLGILTLALGLATVVLVFISG